MKTKSSCSSMSLLLHHFNMNKKLSEYYTWTWIGESSGRDVYTHTLGWFIFWYIIAQVPLLHLMPRAVSILKGCAWANVKPSSQMFDLCIIHSCKSSLDTVIIRYRMCMYSHSIASSSHWHLDSQAIWIFIYIRHIHFLLAYGREKYSSVQITCLLC